MKLTLDRSSVDNARLSLSGSTTLAQSSKKISVYLVINYVDKQGIFMGIHCRQPFIIRYSQTILFTDKFELLITCKLLHFPHSNICVSYM